MFKILFLKSVFLNIFKDVCYQILPNLLIAFKDWSKHLKLERNQLKHLMLNQNTKQFFCYGTKTNNRLFPRINRLFWFQQLNHLKNSFQSFLKTSKYKAIGCFDKTIGCFSLSLKNTFLLKRLRMSMLWIQS